MSKLSVPLLGRQLAIEIAKIVETREEDTAGFPGMTVIDSKGKTHLLTAIDFPSHEWDKIKPGAILFVTMREVVTSTRILESSSVLPWDWNWGQSSGIYDRNTPVRSGN